CVLYISLFFFFSSRRRHTRCYRDWSSDVCSSDLVAAAMWKTVSQYVAITMLIVEKGFDPPGFHIAAATVLWVALGLTVGSAVDRSEERRVGKECRARCRTARE